MGLTIHYTFGSDVRSVENARKVIESLRQTALDVPFKSVGEVIDCSGDDVDFEVVPQDSPHRWLLVQAAQFVTQGNYFYSVSPERLIAFSVDPGDGCEQANFGLAQYPKRIEVEKDGKKKWLATEFPTWHWNSFCKTQFASNPNCGGVQNFLQCHLGVINVLEAARNLDVLREVIDEGEYWEKRDLKALVAEVGDWNAMLAGIAGDQVLAEIFKYPDFEHLEAKFPK